MGIKLRKSTKKKNGLLAGLLLSAICLTGCGTFLDTLVGANEAVDRTEALQTQQNVPETEKRYEITDSDRAVEGKQAAVIDLSRPEEAQREGYTWDDKDLTISGPGDYVLTGELSGGSIIVNVYVDEMVHLILSEAVVNAEQGAAVFVENAGKVILTAEEGTENSLSDGPKYRQKQRACVFSNSDLTLNGDGILRVYGFHGDGVRSKDQVKIINSGLYVKAKEDGIRGNDGVILQESDVEIECEGTGILADSPKDLAVLQGGSCKIVAGKNAIAATQYVSIHETQTDLYSVWEAIKCDGIREWDGEF